ncbi:group-specific protein [Bacillus piscicola]|uniref:group-specific protein n=1 Tax=Bacillus piscicola TaxID=1632684 RepID=UPI001F08D74A|nr:group-specific protein [Bacillus piscicola]
MSKCNIDHSKSSVLEKLASQKEYLPAAIFTHCQELLEKEADQETLNELFHLLKKYDLADNSEKQERNQKITAISV